MTISVSWLHDRPVPTPLIEYVRRLAYPNGPGERRGCMLAEQPDGYPRQSFTNQRRDTRRRQWRPGSTAPRPSNTRRRGLHSQMLPIVRHVRDAEGKTHKIPVLIYRGSGVR